MSLSSTSTIKQQLSAQLGAKATLYFESFNSFVTGRCSRPEFDSAIRNVLGAPTLVQLHNALIISLFDATAVHKRPPTPPTPAITKPPPRKRRRILLPYQGPASSDDTLTFRSARLKRWTLATGKRERDRIHCFESVGSPRQRVVKDEISSERGVILLPERGGWSSVVWVLTFQMTISPNRTPWKSPARSSLFIQPCSDSPACCRPYASHLCSE
jgi:hypothetical protein